MAAIDTDVLVRLVTRDDQARYEKALAFVQSHKPVRVSPLSVLELVWILMSRYGLVKAQALQVVEMLLDLEELDIQQSALLAAALRTWRDSRAELGDCYLLETLKAGGGTPLATFDATLGGLEGAQLL